MSESRRQYEAKFKTVRTSPFGRRARAEGHLMAQLLCPKAREGRGWSSLHTIPGLLPILFPVTSQRPGQGSLVTTPDSRYVVYPMTAGGLASVQSARSRRTLSSPRSAEVVGSKIKVKRCFAPQ